MRASYLFFIITSSLLCFIYIYLTYLVIQCRYTQKVAYLVNDDKAFIAKFRAHANFNEYVPLGLVLLAISAYLDLNIFFYAILCVTFVLGRVVHAYGLINQEPKRNFKARRAGMGLTLLSLIFSAIFNLIKAVHLF